MNLPILSVVIPIFNSADTLDTIVSRILTQPFEDLELILVDDGSTDNSLSIINGYNEQDPRVVVVSQENSGSPSGGRNTGIARARGQFVMFLDSDDDIDPSMIGTLLREIQETNVDLVTCGVQVIQSRENGQDQVIYQGVTPTPKQLETEDFRTYIIRLMGNDSRLYNPINKIFRASIIKEHNLRYLEDLDYGEDFVFNLGYLKHTDRIAFVYEPFYIYLLNPATGTSSRSSLVYENRQRCYQYLLEFASGSSNQALPDLLTWIKLQWLYGYATAISGSHLNRQDKLENLRRAIKSEKLVRPKRLKYIGYQKYLTASVIRFAARNARLLLSFASISSSLSSSRLFTGTWRKMADKVAS